MKRVIQRLFIKVGKWFGIHLYTWDDLVIVRNQAKAQAHNETYYELQSLQKLCTRTKVIKKRKGKK